MAAEWLLRVAACSYQHSTGRLHRTTPALLPRLRLTAIQPQPCKQMQVSFYDKDKWNKDDKMFELWLNTRFLCTSPTMTFVRSELDRVRHTFDYL